MVEVEPQAVSQVGCIVKRMSYGNWKVSRKACTSCGGWLKSPAMMVGLPISPAYANALWRMAELFAAEAPVCPYILTRVVLPKAVVQLIAANLPRMIS
jgi:hypothetical protein